MSVEVSGVGRYRLEERPSDQPALVLGFGNLTGRIYGGPTLVGSAAQ